MQMTHGHYARSWGYRILAMCQMQKSEKPQTTGCSALSHLVTNRRLPLFGHIARSSLREDHHRALAASVRQVPADWKRPAGRPSHTWLRAIEADLGPLNFGLATAWRKATTQDKWRHIVDTAMLQRSTLWKKEVFFYNSQMLNGKLREKRTSSTNVFKRQTLTFHFWTYRPNPFKYLSHHVLVKLHDSVTYILNDPCKFYVRRRIETAACCTECG